MEMVYKGALPTVPSHPILPAPGTPSFLAFSEITSTTLNVSWGEPVAANGVLQGYRVVYEPLAPVQGKARGAHGEGTALPSVCRAGSLACQRHREEGVKPSTRRGTEEETNSFRAGGGAGRAAPSKGLGAWALGVWSGDRGCACSRRSPGDPPAALEGGRDGSTPSPLGPGGADPPLPPCCLSLVPL